MLKNLQEPLHENRYHFWRGRGRKGIYYLSCDKPVLPKRRMISGIRGAFRSPGLQGSWCLPRKIFLKFRRQHHVKSPPPAHKLLRGKTTLLLSLYQ
jgi:hypothetical protein